MSTIKTENVTKKDIDDLLNQVEFFELQKFISYYSHKNKEFALEFKTYFVQNTISLDDKKHFAELLRKTVKQHRSQGFINHSQSNKLAIALQPHLTTIEHLIIDEDYQSAANLSEIFIKEIIKVIEYSDDSSGNLTQILLDAIAYINELLTSINLPKAVQKNVLTFCEKELKKDIYFDYGDYGIALLNSYCLGCIESSYHKRFLTFIDQKIKSEQKNSFLYNYLIQLKIQFFDLIKDFSSKTTLIQENLHIVEVRELAVTSFIENREFDLAKEQLYLGLEQARELDHYGTIYKWEQALLNIAEQCQDIEQMRLQYKKLALFGTKTDKKYLEKWKMTYSHQEWSSVADQTIQELINTAQLNYPLHSNYYHSVLLDTLAPFFILDNQKDSLFDLLKKVNNIDQVLLYVEELRSEYSYEVFKPLFTPLLLAEAKKASGRSHYKYLVRYFKKIQQQFPKDTLEIMKIVLELKALYPRRTAMIEELNKLKM